MPLLACPLVRSGIFVYFCPGKHFAHQIMCLALEETPSLEITKKQPWVSEGVEAELMALVYLEL